MTTANLMSVPSVNGMPAQTDASKKLQEENLEVAEMFAGFMNQTIEISNSMVDDTSSNMDVSKTNSTQTPAESYERYTYKDKQIDTAKEPNVSEQMEQAEEALEQTSEEIVNTLCEEYGVDEETIQNLLDTMGLSALDLLNPQNLVSFIVALTGAASGEELLLDENFLTVMETMDNLAEGLMKDLGVDMEGLQTLIAEMEVVNTDIELSSGFQDVLNSQLEQVEVDTTAKENDMVEQTVTTKETENVELSTKEPTEETVETVVEEDTEEVVKNTTQNPEDVEVEEQTDTSKAKVQEVETEDADLKQNSNQESSFTDSRNSEGNSLLNHNTNANDNIVVNQNVMSTSQISDVPQMQFNSYLSADTVQIMEQIVQQMRVNITSEMTSMEMQLNPENLGKVYVNISSEEGVVNAQFHATNEVVKEALEAQIATLRENLNQAGVKVDAIEVTIASHEFERNLEQNHQNPQEQVEAQEEKSNRRRNITVDSLDELSGVMTEEETLVAQMMKDNGNSVDFTA